MQCVLIGCCHAPVISRVCWLGTCVWSAVVGKEGKYVFSRIQWRLLVLAGTRPAAVSSVVGTECLLTEGVPVATVSQWLKPVKDVAVRQSVKSCTSVSRQTLLVLLSCQISTSIVSVWPSFILRSVNSMRRHVNSCRNPSTSQSSSLAFCSSVFKFFYGNFLTFHLLGIKSVSNLSLLYLSVAT